MVEDGCKKEHEEEMRKKAFVSSEDHDVEQR